MPVISSSFYHEVWVAVKDHIIDTAARWRQSITKEVGHLSVCGLYFPYVSVDKVICCELAESEAEIAMIPPESMYGSQCIYHAFRLLPSRWDWIVPGAMGL